MPRLIHTDADFARQAINGLVAANQQTLTQVNGGVVRAKPGTPNQVAVVIGGGSGHYPAFAGLVGPGLASGAVCGNIFASPSASQVREVAQACHRGGGVLLSYGNYAGDVLHFGQAERKLREQGIPTETIIVTDDIASTDTAAGEKGRGIAGDLVVFKIAGAAAEAGLPLTEVARIANKANTRTTSLGVAFAGCTLPGANEPLFDVPAGKVSIGLGIHGEPGISEIDLPSGEELADLLVTRLLEAKPEGALNTVVPLVNGLGTVKYEELFVLYSHIHHLLEEAGLTIVEPEVGELVTSLDMAGLSLTLFWPDDELTMYWSAPATSAAYCKRSATTVPQAEPSSPFDEAVTIASHAHADSKAPEPKDLRRSELGPLALAALIAIRDALSDAAKELGRIDAIAGDGDHGIGMQRGSHGAAQEATALVQAGLGIAPVLAAAGESWSNQGGGTSGALWGETLAAIGQSLAAADPFDPTQLGTAITAGLNAVQQAGGAAVGDKTMVDAFVPFADTLRAQLEQGRQLELAWATAAEAASLAAEATATLTPRKGRARPLAKRSIGHPDAGAVSFALIVSTISSLKLFVDAGSPSGPHTI